MALLKEIVGQDGVVTRYHRVVRVDNMTNQRTTIEVSSYVSEESRQKQLLDEKAQSEGIDITAQQYTVASYYTFEYVDGMTAESAYAALKTLDRFAGAEDV